MPQRLHLRRSGLFGAAIGCACGLTASSLAAQELPSPPPAVPLSPTSQCVEGPGAPPADPSKVTRVAPGAKAGAAADAEADAPGAPSRVLLELGAAAGASIRFDDAPTFVTTRRAGLVLGGSLFLSPNRSLSLGLSYAHADLSRSETPPLAVDVVSVDYEAHTLIGEVRVTPFHFAGGGVFASVGAGLAWQTASLHAAFAPLNGAPADSFACSVGSGANFAFRAGIGVKARLGHALSFLGDAGFVGYRFEGGALDACSPGAGTAQTVMLRAGLTYDLDVTRIAR